MGWILHHTSPPCVASVSPKPNTLECIEWEMHRTDLHSFTSHRRRREMERDGSWNRKPVRMTLPSCTPSSLLLLTPRLCPHTRIPKVARLQSNKSTRNSNCHHRYANRFALPCQRAWSLNEPHRSPWTGRNANVQFQRCFENKTNSRTYSKLQRSILKVSAMLVELWRRCYNWLISNAIRRHRVSHIMNVI